MAAVSKVKLAETLKNVDLLLKEDRALSPQISATLEQLVSIVVSQAELLQRAEEQIQPLSDEIAVLKGNKPRPKIPKSKLEGKGAKSDEKKDPDDKRPGSTKRSKTAQLEIHETVSLNPDGVKKGWIFKGYSDVIVQGLIIEPHNTKYRRARWLTPQTGRRLQRQCLQEFRVISIRS